MQRRSGPAYLRQVTAQLPPAQVPTTTSTRGMTALSPPTSPRQPPIKTPPLTTRQRQPPIKTPPLPTRQRQPPTKTPPLPTRQRQPLTKAPAAARHITIFTLF